ncbi:MAG: hypothetical protein JKP98_07665 [Rhodobacteraceae bacterium]|nr:hypothetical protein [Paracoccaceae bacterium]
MTGAASDALARNPRAGSGRRLSMAVLAFGIATVVCFMVWSPLMDVLLGRSAPRSPRRALSAV